MIDISHIIRVRLMSLQYFSKIGVIPGDCDTYELHELKGRIKELELVLKILAAETIGEAAAVISNELSQEVPTP